LNISNQSLKWLLSFYDLQERGNLLRKMYGFYFMINKVASKELGGGRINANFLGGGFVTGTRTKGLSEVLIGKEPLSH